MHYDVTGAFLKACNKVCTSFSTMSIFAMPSHLIGNNGDAPRIFYKVLVFLNLGSAGSSQNLLASSLYPAQSLLLDLLRTAFTFSCFLSFWRIRPYELDQHQRDECIAFKCDDICFSDPVDIGWLGFSNCKFSFQTMVFSDNSNNKLSSAVSLMLQKRLRLFPSLDSSLCRDARFSMHSFLLKSGIWRFFFLVSL